MWEAGSGETFAEKLLQLTGTQKFEPRPFSGKYLQVAVDIDVDYPGHLRAVLQGSDLTRQAKFLTYAEIMGGNEAALAQRLRGPEAPSTSGNAETDRAVIGRALAILQPRDVVEAVFGAVPDGLLGLLARLGADPLADPSLYRTAFSLYADPQHQRRAALLRQIEGKVSPTKIAAAARLPDVLLRAAVLNKIHDVPVQLPSLCAFVNYIRVVCDADDAAIAHSLNDLRPGTSGQDLKSWAQTWMMRQVRLHVPPPIPVEDAAFSLIVGRDLARIGREFRNCLGERLAEAFLASTIHYLWTDAPGGAAVVALSPLSDGGWFVEDVRQARNRRLSSSAVRELRAALSKYGITIHLLAPESGPSPHALRHLINSWASGLDLSDDDDEEQDCGGGEEEAEVLRHLDRLLAGINGEPVPDGYYEDETETA